MTVCVECERPVSPTRGFRRQLGRAAVVCSECSDGTESTPVAPLADATGGESE